MYNEELKTKFVQWYTKSVNTAKLCETIFNSTEKHEAKIGADICTMDEQALQLIIDDVVGGIRHSNRWNYLTILRSYVKWCELMNIPNVCDDIFKINTVGLGKIRQQTVSSPLHLETYLNKICEPVDEKTTDNIYRCFYWLAYAGIKEEDILNIRIEDVDLSKMVVKYNDTEVPIYREAVPVFKNCMELTQFVYKHPIYLTGTVVWKDRCPGNTLVRGVNSQISLKAMRVELSRRSKAKRDRGITDLKLSYYRVWISGVFYRIYEKEQMGIEPDLSDVVSQQVEGRTYKLDKGRNTQDAKKRQLAHDYIEDYNRWKLAYKK